MYCITHLWSLSVGVDCLRTEADGLHFTTWWDKSQNKSSTIEIYTNTIFAQQTKSYRRQLVLVWAQCATGISGTATPLVKTKQLSLMNETA